MLTVFQVAERLADKSPRNWSKNVDTGAIVDGPTNGNPAFRPLTAEQVKAEIAPKLEVFKALREDYANLLNELSRIRGGFRELGFAKLPDLIEINIVPLGDGGNYVAFDPIPI